MNVAAEPGKTPARNALHWQSQAVLLALVPASAVWVTLLAGQAWNQRDPVLWQGLAISIGFTVLVRLTRAATTGGALTGGIFTAALYLSRPGLHTPLWPLLALLLFTLGATRFGKRRKEKLGTAESRRGRSASQVAANLGVAVLAAIPLSTLYTLNPEPWSRKAAMLGMIAAMAEATADTVSSELGQVLGGEPRLITTFQRVAVGTNGGVSLAGTLMGCGAAAIIVGLSRPVLGLTNRDALVALAAAIFGLFLDSLLGALAERRGFLNNDAVNALATLSAAALAACAMR